MYKLAAMNTHTYTLSPSWVTLLITEQSFLCSLLAESARRLPPFTQLFSTRLPLKRPTLLHPAHPATFLSTTAQLSFRGSEGSSPHLPPPPLFPALLSCSHYFSTNHFHPKINSLQHRKPGNTVKQLLTALQCSSSNLYIHLIFPQLVLFGFIVPIFLWFQWKIVVGWWGELGSLLGGIESDTGSFLSSNMFLSWHKQTRIYVILS